MSLRGARLVPILVLGAAAVLAALGVAWAQAPPAGPGAPAAQTAPQPTAPAAPPAPPVAQPAPPAGPPGVITPGRPGRDPFEPLVTRPEPPAAAEPGARERREPLAALKLVGIVWDARDRARVRALVETQDGLGYYVRVNEERFGGRVVAIERDRVRFSVREQVPGGPVRERTVELRLGLR